MANSTKRDGRGRPHYIYAWPRARKMTQERLAELADCGIPTISMVEHGRQGITLALLQRIAVALGVPAGWLLSRNPDDTTDAWEIAEELRRLPPEERQRAREILRAFTASIPGQDRQA